MKWLIRVLIVVLLVAGVFWLCSLNDSSNVSLRDYMKQKAWEVLVDAPPNEVGPSWSYIVKTDENAVKSMASCPIESGTYGGGCTLEIVVWSSQTPLASFVVSSGEMEWRATYNGISDGNYQYTMQIGTIDDGVLAYANLPIPDSGYIAYSWDWSWLYSGAYLDVVSSSSPIGEKGATHSKELIVSESWEVPTGAELTMSLSGSGGINLTFTKEVTIGAMSTVFNELILTSPGDFPTYNDKYISISDITFCGNPIDTTSYPEQTINGEETENSWVRNDGSSGFEFFMKNVPSTPALDAWTGATVNPPYSYDFSNMNVKWMDGSSANNVEVYCTGIRLLNAEGYDIGPWHGTMAQLKALGRVTQKYGLHSWDTWEPDMSNVCSLYMDYHSMRELGMLDHGEPEIKVEGAMYGATGTEEETIPSPIDGDYYSIGLHNGMTLFTNGLYWIWSQDSEGTVWGIGPDKNLPAYYISEDGGPNNIYFFNEAGGYEDAIIDVETGQRRFTGWLGLGPVVSEQLNAIDPDTSTPSFSHDGTICFNGWPLSATNRTSAPDMQDVVQLLHRDWVLEGDWYVDDEVGIGVYADAHTHEDWVGDGCTVPDADGNFNVSVANGSLTLDLRSYYIARQAGTYVPLPNRYWVREHDAYYGDYAEEPLHEAIWDWRGWPYLQSQFTLPALLTTSPYTEITITLEYYHDLLGVTDNHFTGGDRESGYSYNPGEVFTFTKTQSINVRDSNRLAKILTDLYFTEEPLSIVKSIKFSFKDTGTYKLAEPHLMSDPGDEQEPRERYINPLTNTVIHGGLHKFFESPRYAQGGFSVCYDGIFDRQFYIPDNVKPNQIEYCFPTLNVVIGAKSGLDMTSSFSIAGLPVSSDAWLWNYSAGAEEAHMKDSDGNWLKTLNCYDVIPYIDRADVCLAVRCGQITCVNGLPYSFYGIHYVGGYGHGMAKTENEAYPRKRTAYPYTDVADIYVRPLASTDEADYVLAEDDIRATEHGHWFPRGTNDLGEDTPPPHAAAPTTSTQVLQSYAIKGKEYYSYGRLATREYSAADVTVVNRCRDIYVVEHSTNIIYVLEYWVGGGIDLIYTSPADMWYKTGKSQVSYGLPKNIAEDAKCDGSPAGYVDKNGTLYVYYTKNNSLKKITSSNMGTSWEAEVEVIPSTQNISKSVEANIEGVQYCFAIDSSGVFWCYKSTSHFADATWTIGTNKFQIATSASSDNNPGWYYAKGVLNAFYFDSSGNRKNYQSLDTGKNWTEVVAV